MEPLYCFKFNDITGEITRIEIPEYRRIVNTYSGIVSYRWDNPRINKSDTHFSVDSTKIDRFVSYKVFTFNDDYDYACKVIQETLLKDADMLEKQLSRKYELLNIHMKAQAHRRLVERGLLK